MKNATPILTEVETIYEHALPLWLLEQPALLASRLREAETSETDPLPRRLCIRKFLAVARASLEALETWEAPKTTDDEDEALLLKEIQRIIAHAAVYREALDALEAALDAPPTLDVAALVRLV